MLRVVMFGSFQVSCDANSDIKLSGTMKRLFAYLLLQRYRPQPRELLASVFWGDRSQERAHKCLNNALWRLRTVLGQDEVRKENYLVTSNTGEVAFNFNSNHWIDLVAFEDKARILLSKTVKHPDDLDKYEIQTIQSLYRGDLLEGFYDDWALRAREHFRKLYLDSLTLHMRYYQQADHLQLAIEKGLMILELDPLREEIHREIMRLYLATGQRTMAIRQYAHCTDLLNRELGISPMVETQLLYGLCAEDDTAKLKTDGNTSIKTKIPYSSIITSPVDIKTVHRQLEKLSVTLTNAQQQLELIKEQVKKLHESPIKK